MAPLVLASTSRYRQALLARLRVPFEALAPELDESPLQTSGRPPTVIAQALAYEKARLIHLQRPDAIVIGGDQGVAFEGAFLGKPGNAEGALAQLRSLAGKTHELITAVTVLYRNSRFDHVDRTRLTLAALDDDALRRYIAADEPYDCAGSYKIESLGCALLERVEGNDPSAIEGLPLIAVARFLRQLGVLVP